MIKRLLTTLAALLFAAVTVCHALVVSVEPVEIFNAPELSAMGAGIQSVLASRVAGPGVEVVTSADSEKSADWKIKTTITLLGGVYSIDGSIVNVAGTKAGERTYETVSDKEKLMEGLSKVAQRLKNHLAPSVPAASMPQTVGATPVVSPKIQSAPAMQAVSPAAGSGVTGNYSLLGTLKGEPRTLDVLDVNGDGADDFVMLMEEELAIYTVAGGAAEHLISHPLDLPSRPLYASTADIDGDGSAEVLVSWSRNHIVYSKAYRLGANSLAPISEEVKAFVRIAKHPVEGFKLIGLSSKGGPEVFKRQLYSYSLEGNEIKRGKEIVTKGNQMPVNVSWISANGSARVDTLIIDEFDHVRIYGPDNSKLYETEEVVMGGRSFFVGEMRNQQTLLEGDRYEVNSPASELNGLLVIHDNQEGFQLTRNMGSYDNGVLRAYSWDGLAMRPVWMSPTFQGFFAATTPAKSEKGLYALLVKSEGFLDKEYTASILLFDL
ncbi:MAG: hypothetical protein C0609_07985 [Deltaproteobacteria bacterium]|nr:MAG: hypothetical protein C0609_07985 [Deltaproteobacteria bacterium]